MPTILSRLRGLIAPVALDEPLRLADAGGVTPGTGSGGGIVLIKGRPGPPGKRSFVPGLAGATGAAGAAGATGGAGAAGATGAPGAFLRGRTGLQGRRSVIPGLPGSAGAAGAAGATGGTGATGAQQPVGAAWVNFSNGLPIVLPVNAVPRMISGTYAIKEVTILTEGGVGSCVIKIWKANYSSHYPPISSDDITGGANVTISGGTVYDDSTLSGWTTALSQGDILLFTLASVSGFSYVQVQLRIG
jgi:hypothetical protein